MADESRTAPVVHVMLPLGLVGLFPGCPRDVEVQAATVAGMMEALDTRWRGIRDRLCDSTPAIRRHIHIFVAGERANLDTALASGTDVLVMTAISGG